MQDTSLTQVTEICKRPHQGLMLRLGNALGGFLRCSLRSDGLAAVGTRWGDMGRVRMRLLPPRVYLYDHRACTSDAGRGIENERPRKSMGVFRQHLTPVAAQENGRLCGAQPTDLNQKAPYVVIAMAKSAAPTAKH